MVLSHIVAVSKNYVIGIENRLPWFLPADMLYFKDTTQNHVVIMGRKNYESEGNPLTNRKNIVITRQKNYSAPGCIVVNSIAKAIKTAEKYEKEETFIIGGGEIYKQTLGLINKIYITIIDAKIDGDVFYPSVDLKNWELLIKRYYPKDQKNPYNHTYYIYEKIKLVKT